MDTVTKGFLGCEIFLSCTTLDKKYNKILVPSIWIYFDADTSGLLKSGDIPWSGPGITEAIMDTMFLSQQVVWLDLFAHMQTHWSIQSSR